MKLSQVTVYTDEGERSRILLDRLSLDIHSGEWLSIVGRNGSGKSTLAKVLSGILQPTTGSIERSLMNCEPIPYVMQEAHPFLGQTPWEELIFLLETRGEPAADIPLTAERILRQTGLLSQMHRPIKELSGGRRQLVAIACCLACRAPLMIFDEAASMLDSKSKALVLGLARQLHQNGHTIIWLTHQLDEVTEGSRVIVMDQGRIRYEGTTREFFYGTAHLPMMSATPCEQAGFEPPYPIRIALHLHRNQSKTIGYPLTVSQLTEALQHDAR